LRLGLGDLAELVDEAEGELAVAHGGAHLVRVRVGVS
jgi:hypothetical protein